MRSRALDYAAPLTVTEASSEVVWEGTGPELEDGGPVLLDYRLAAGRRRRRWWRRRTRTVPKPFTLTPEVLSEDLYDALERPDGRHAARSCWCPGRPTRRASRPSWSSTCCRPGRGASRSTPREGLPAVHPRRRRRAGHRRARGRAADVARRAGPAQGRRRAGRRGLDRDRPVRRRALVGRLGVRLELDAGRTAVRSTSAPAVLPGLAEGLLEQTVGSQVLLVIPPRERRRRRRRAGHARARRATCWPPRHRRADADARPKEG